MSFIASIPFLSIGWLKDYARSRTAVKILEKVTFDRILRLESGIADQRSRLKDGIPERRFIIYAISETRHS